jgi:hypothetical protein
MPRYQINLILTVDAETMRDAAEMADDLCEMVEEGEWYTLPPGDSSLRPASIAWPLD